LGEVADACLGPRLRLDQAEQPQPCRVGKRLQRRSEVPGVVCRKRLGEEGRAAGRNRREGLHRHILTHINVCGIIEALIAVNA
jgi:hypothetical protein